MKFTIPQIKEAAPDFIIAAVQGTLKALFPEKTGNNAQGPWCIQRGVLQQGADEIEIFFKDRDPLHASWKGREVIIEAHHGDKGWSGVYAFDDTYKSQTKRVVKVTGTGKVSLIENGRAHSGPSTTGQTAQTAQQTKPQDPPPQQQQAPPQKPAEAPAPPQNPPQGSGNKIAEAINAANQVANLQLLCIGKVETYVAPRVKAKLGREPETGERHAWAMNMAIELMRKGIQWHMPTTELPPIAPPPQNTPKPQAPDDRGMHDHDQLF